MRARRWLVVVLMATGLLLTSGVFYSWYVIPGSSMRPTLVPGDFMAVERLAYGLREPFSGKLLLPLGQPARGDVLVFRLPSSPDTRYVLRVVGLPGDVIDYRNKQLWINGRPQPQTPVGKARYVDPAPSGLDVHEVSHWQESLGGRLYSIFTEESDESFDMMALAVTHEKGVHNFPENCRYDVESSLWFRCTVPAGHYFALGDNRDHSNDSRYWGFVPEGRIVGRVGRVLFNTKDVWSGGHPVE